MTRRRIKKATIKRIALCARPKNGMTVLYKADTQTVDFVTLSKMTEEGLLTALVYAPNMVDSDGDYADPEAIREFAHTFIREGAQFDIQHSEKPLTADQIYLAESTIVQKGDTRFDGFVDRNGRPVDPVGGWGIIAKVLDPDIRSRIKADELNGVSLFGPAVVEIIKSEPKEAHMDPEQLKKLLEAQAASLSAVLVKAIEGLKPTPVETKTEVTKAALPFEGDPTKIEDVEAHADKLLFASLDLSKAQDVIKWKDHLTKKQAAKPAAPKPEAKTDLEKAQADLVAAQTRIAELQKASNQPATNGAPASEQIVGLTKAQSDAAGLARKLAAEMNKAAGRV